MAADDLEEVIERIEISETEHDVLRRDFEELKKLVTSMNVSVQEMLLILQTIKLGGNILAWAVLGLKWLGIMAVAILSILALFKAFQTGTITIPSSKIPE